jgi:DNA processing protein
MTDVHELSRDRHPRLWQVVQPPERLVALGSEAGLELLSRLPERGLAVVGTRRPLPRSVQECRRRIRPLKGSGIVILSGLAHGIDQAAHEAALECGLPTIAILGCGVLFPLSREQEALKTRILRSGGLIVSEFEPCSYPYPSQYLQRNRLIAGWAQATWVVQAPHRSGALSTASWAMKMGRKLLVTPCFPDDPAFSGNQRLIDRDHAELMWSTDSFATEWLELVSHCARGRQLRLPVSPLLQRLGVSPDPVEISSLLDHFMGLGWSPARFFGELRELHQAGHVRQRNGIVFRNE